MNKQPQPQRALLVLRLTSYLNLLYVLQQRPNEQSMSSENEVRNQENLLIYKFFIFNLSFLLISSQSYFECDAKYRAQ